MSDDEPTVEVPLSAVRASADILKHQARINYSNGPTTWADRFQGHARQLNDAAGDEWDDVGMERYHEDS